MADFILFSARTNPVSLPLNPGDRQVQLRLRIEPSEELQRAVPELPTSEAGGTDVCLLLDVSGSMKDPFQSEAADTGELQSKLNACREATRPLIELLRPSDTLSIVRFNKTATVACSHLSSDQAAAYYSAIDELTPTGQTILGGALNTAREVLQQGNSQRTRRIILLTDGRVTENRAEPLAAAEQLAAAGITLDCMGFSGRMETFDLSFVQGLVAPTRGRTEIIRRASDVKDLFARWIGNAKNVVATNVKLALRFADQVRVSDHYRGAPENSYLGKVPFRTADRLYTLDLGVLERNQRQDYFFSLTVSNPSGEHGKIRIIHADLSYEVPALQQRGLKHSAEVCIDFVERPSGDGQIAKGFAIAELKRFEQECDAARRDKNHAEAIRLFREMIKRYHEHGMVADRQRIESALTMYEQTQNVPQELLNEISASSSKPADSGQIARRLSSDVLDQIMGRRR